MLGKFIKRAVHKLLHTLWGEGVAITLQSVTEGSGVESKLMRLLRKYTWTP